MGSLISKINDEIERHGSLKHYQQCLDNNGCEICEPWNFNKNSTLVNDNK